MHPVVKVAAVVVASLLAVACSKKAEPSSAEIQMEPADAAAEAAADAAANAEMAAETPAKEDAKPTPKKGSAAKSTKEAAHK